MVNDAPTFVCLRCSQRKPVSERYAADEPFDAECYAANQAEAATRQAEEQAHQDAIGAGPAEDEDDGQGQLFQ